MSGIYDDSNRQIIPRWYSFNTACQMGDLEPESVRESPKHQSPQAFEQKVLDWRSNKTAFHAVDLVGTALITGDYSNSDAKEAAQFILSAAKNVPSLGREIAEIFSTGSSEPASHDSVGLKVKLPQVRLEIARLKAMIRRYPRNAIALPLLSSGGPTWMWCSIS